MNDSTKNDIYNVTNYTDDELFGILDLNSPSDRELEAKIIIMINKYKNSENEDSQRLHLFFEDIYNHFFDSENSEEEQEIDTSDEREGMTNITADVTANTISAATKMNNSTKNNTENDSDVKKEANKTKDTEADKGNDKDKSNVSLTKNIEYKLDKQNPILKETIKRVITIDSQYRDNKNESSTNFTFILSDPLKNIVSLKLYSVHIPYTWYTINTHFGSNFFYIKGNSDGINDGTHDYEVSVPSGNYNSDDLISAVNTSIKELMKVNTDVSFGNTGLTINQNKATVSFNVDIYNQYSETSYYLQFNETDWLSPSSIDTLRKNSIPSFLGFDTFNTYPLNTYYPYKLKSDRFIKLNNNNLYNIRNYALDVSNNYFTVYKYIDSSFNYTANSLVDLSFNIYFSLTPGNNYTIIELVNDLNNQIQNNTYLNSSESHIQLNDYSNNSIYSGYSFFELSLKTNRYTTRNLQNSKLAVVFPKELNSANPIWVGNTSCFHFIDYNQEINSIISDTSPLKETSLVYLINSSPYIQVNCTKNGYNLPTNNYVFNIQNSSNNGYTLTDYVGAINNSIINVNNIYNEFYLLYTKAYVDNNNYFNIQFDINKKINQENFVIDFSGSFLNQVMNFDLSYDLMTTNVLTSNFNFSSNYTLNGNIATMYARTPNNKVNNDVSYNIVVNNQTTVSYSNLHRTILNLFHSYVDDDLENVFKNTNLSLSIVNNQVYAELTIGFQKTLTQNDYSIQFFDVSNINQSFYTLQTTGDSLGFFNSKMGFENSYALTNNTIITYFDKTKITKINTNYLFNLQKPANEKNYLNALNEDEITNYLIPSPSGDYTNNMTKLETDINKIFTSYSELSGTNIKFVENNNIITSTLTIVVNKSYVLNLSESTWYNNLDISNTMITSSYKLSNSNINSTVSYSNIIGTVPITLNYIRISSTNNTIQINAYESGVYSSNGTNNILLKIPYNTTLGYTNYSLNNLISEINAQFSANTLSNSSLIGTKLINGIQYTYLNLNINKAYTATDYNITFYQPQNFLNFGINNINTFRNASWDSTIGWILGYRNSPIYYLSQYASSSSNNVINLVSDICFTNTLYNYFIICIDDYNLNRINDSLVSITNIDSSVSYPSYSNKSNYIIDPVSGKKTYNTTKNNEYNKLTNNQLYSINQSLELSQTVSNVKYLSYPYVKDVFGIIPLKLTGLKPGQIYSEFGGTLQNQERVYFGPVNIFKMSVQLLSDRGDLIDLNGVDWSFSFICEQIYKKE